MKAKITALVLAGILVGLAVGQVTAAQSVRDPSLPVLKSIDRKVSSIDKRLLDLRRVVAPAYTSTNMLEELESIARNTFGTCIATQGSPYSAYCQR